MEWQVTYFADKVPQEFDLWFPIQCQFTNSILVLCFPDNQLKYADIIIWKVYLDLMQRGKAYGEIYLCMLGFYPKEEIEKYPSVILFFHKCAGPKFDTVSLYNI